MRLKRSISTTLSINRNGYRCGRNFWISLMSSCVPTCVSLIATETAPSVRSQTSYYKGNRPIGQLNILPATDLNGRRSSHPVSRLVLPCLFHGPTSLPTLPTQTDAADAGNAARADAARISQPGKRTNGPVLRIPRGKVAATRHDCANPPAETPRRSSSRGLETCGGAGQVATPGAGPLRHRLPHWHPGQDALSRFRRKSRSEERRV